jgi:hypothetical protein
MQMPRKNNYTKASALDYSDDDGGGGGLAEEIETSVLHKVSLK